MPALASNPRRADPLDGRIGGIIRARRIARGLSQTDLGRRLGVTFQQVQKYEKGTNRIGAGRLARIAQVLGVTPAFFYDLPADGGAAPTDYVTAFLGEARAHRLAKAYLSLPPELRDGFVRCIERTAAAMAKPARKRGRA